MIALVNGEEGAGQVLFKGGATMWRIHLLSDGTEGPTGQVLPKGTPLDLTGDTVSVEFYDSSDRRNAAVTSLSTTLTTATSGFVTATVANATIDFGPGTYWAFIKRTENTGTTAEFSRVYNTVMVK
jgi:hypothetical protein